MLSVQNKSGSNERSDQDGSGKSVNSRANSVSIELAAEDEHAREGEDDCAVSLIRRILLIYAASDSGTFTRGQRVRRRRKKGGRARPRSGSTERDSHGV